MEKEIIKELVISNEKKISQVDRKGIWRGRNFHPSDPSIISKVTYVIQYKDMTDILPKAWML
jgi:hypothetical protein